MRRFDPGSMRVFAAAYNLCRMVWEHISDDDLERYCLGRIKDKGELTRLEEHLLECPSCMVRAEKEQELVDWIRAALNAEGRTLE